MTISLLRVVFSPKVFTFSFKSLSVSSDLHLFFKIHQVNQLKHLGLADNEAQFDMYKKIQFQSPFLLLI